jgi:ribosomal-protein-serine acetyltransferase
LPPGMMFYCTINDVTELRLIGHEHRDDLYQSLDSNREYLRPWHPWVDAIRTAADAERAINLWQMQQANNRGFYAGIWHRGRFCGVINHLTVDWTNRSTSLSYWLDAAHQGQGIMTACCRGMIQHGFGAWKLNRIAIECATENARSRAIAERLGFKLEGIVRGIEWLHDHFADHALYGLLRSDYTQAGLGTSVASLDHCCQSISAGQNS